MATKIETHVSDAVDRLITQYKGKPRFIALISAFVAQHQIIEDKTFEFYQRLDILTAAGAQLDGIGEIVGQTRGGLDDENYRILIFAKIGQNVSNGDPERLITIFKLLTGASFVHYMNLSGGEIQLATDGTLNESVINFVFDQLQRSVAAGVRINEFIFFDKDEPFAFAGVNTSAPARGFGSVGNPTVGGKFAHLFRKNPPFSFAGKRTSDGGFGSRGKPLVGGVFQ